MNKEERSILIEALSHLESMEEPEASNGELVCRLWAAHYLIQGLLGQKPLNYEAVVQAARSFDQAGDAINNARYSGSAD